jgi:hypothetical protein
LTDEQQELCTLGWELRLAERERRRELWFAVVPEALPAAHHLHQRGWFDRGIAHDPEATERRGTVSTSVGHRQGLPVREFGKTYGSTYTLIRSR